MRHLKMFAAISALLLAVAVSCKPSYSVPEPEDVMMYQVNPRVFAAENSFDEIALHLDEIKDLGVNVVWFMPIYPVGQVKSVNSPYCIRDYRGVNPEFGTMEDFRSLVEGCHERGMSVILDWVANHTAWDNPWLAEHEDWYTRDSTGTVIWPAGTNWQDVADLDFDNADMCREMIESMKFWVNESGIDGFRCDAADFVPYEFWKQMCSELRTIPGRKLLLLAEGGRKDHLDAGFEMNYGWAFLAGVRRVFERGEPASMLFDVDKEEYEGLPEGCVRLRFTSNHDEASKQSAVSEFGGREGSMSAFVISAFMHGGALIYGSQEVAYPDPVNFFHYVPVDWSSNPDVRAEYTRLMELYNSMPALRKGAMSAFPDDNVCMFSKSLGAEEILVVANVRGSMAVHKGGAAFQSTGMPEVQQNEETEEETIIYPDGGAQIMALPGGWAGVEVTDLMSGESLTLDSELKLKGFEYRLFKKNQ